MTPETALKTQIKDYLDIQGFFHYPLSAGYFSVKGLPDRQAIKNGVTINIEAKSNHYRQTFEQLEFQKKTESHGGIYLLIYDIEELMDWIEQHGLADNMRLIK